MNLNLEEFQPKMARQREDGSWTAGIRPHKVHVFIGMRGSGKSTGMKHVMHSMRNSFDNGILMSATEEVHCMQSLHRKPVCLTRVCYAGQ